MYLNRLIKRIGSYVIYILLVPLDKGHVYICIAIVIQFIDIVASIH